MRLKKFTEKNLLADDACTEGMEFVLPLINKGKDVALALYRAQEWRWLWWAAIRDYDLSSLGPKQRLAVIKNSGFEHCLCTVCSRARKNINSAEAKK